MLSHICESPLRPLCRTVRIALYLYVYICSLSICAVCDWNLRCVLCALNTMAHTYRTNESNIHCCCLYIQGAYLTALLPLLSAAHPALLYDSIDLEFLLLCLINVYSCRKTGLMLYQVPRCLYLSLNFSLLLLSLLLCIDVLTCYGCCYCCCCCYRRCARRWRTNWASMFFASAKAGLCK